ncbi:CsbD-like [Moraxella lacunata]|uniref:CsbD-like n=1 Tax=Moraxella lacunata TaxID=477 RepID=A0A378T5W5_MORLA|nr:CsbD-like [Moraxella lacunata]
MSIDGVIGKTKEVAGKVLDDKELQAEGIVQ